jgi:hypothetical protein
MGARPTGPRGSKKRFDVRLQLHESRIILPSGLKTALHVPGTSEVPGTWRVSSPRGAGRGMNNCVSILQDCPVEAPIPEQ